MNFTKPFLGLAIVTICLFFSCSNDSSDAPDTETITDDFSYTTVNDNGEINSIGNNSGKITLLAKFNSLTATPVNLNTICSNANSIFLIEHKSPQDKLYIFNKNSKTTTSKTLSYPDKITGFEPLMFVLEWNESKSLLYGIIASNPYSESDNINYFVTINPSTYEVNYSNISFSQKNIYSTFSNGSKIYCTSYTDDVFEINPDENTATAIPFNNSKIPLIRTVMYSNSIAYGLNANTTLPTLVKIDVTNKTYLDILPNEKYGAVNNYGKGFIDKTNNEYINLVSKNNLLGILKYKITNNTTEFIPVTTNITNYNINTVIIQ
ncbi:hypothetical protein ACSV4D_16240 [Flavobacterium sp. ARAG 55.4]|uniref:hypothetical protein n=1 Tax=Flavobacterium sp. ARAG 55.4 TaxID=3451357 RepID=UPI003F445608